MPHGVIGKEIVDRCHVASGKRCIASTRPFQVRMIKGPPPAITTREPDPQPRDPHRRRHPDPPPDTRPGLLRQETRRRQNKQRSTPSAETPHLRRRLPASRRRRPTPQQLNNERVREGQPGTSLNPAWPASHPDHRLFGSVTSRTRHQTYTPLPMFDIGLEPTRPKTNHLTQRGFDMHGWKVVVSRLP